MGSTRAHFRQPTKVAIGLAVVAMASLGILAPAQVAEAATMATVYASPTGGGTACTSAAPCTLAGAQTMVRSLNSGMTGDIIVQLAGGTYRPTSSMAFTSADSATNGHTISWQAASGQTPTISGGVALSGWTQVDATKNIWAATLPSSVTTRDLWVNGTRATLAQGGTLPSGSTKTSTGYTVPGNAMQSLADPADLQFVLNPGNWVQDVCGVSSISGTSTSTTVTMAQPCFATAAASGYISLGLPSVIENNYSYLTGPNQWSFNSTTHVVDLIPPTGVTPSSADIEAGNLATVLAVNGTSSAPVTGLQFSGITFADTTWPAVNGGNGYTEIQADVIFPDTSCATEFSPASFESGTSGSSHDGLPFGACNTTMPSAVEVHAGRSVTLSGDTFVNLGTAGATYDGGTQSSSITGNSFTDVGGNGIQVGSVANPNQSNTALVDTGITVNDNYINAAADEYQGGVGIWAGYTKTLSITHNDIENLAYSGISTGWGWGSVDTLPTIDTGNQVTDNFVSDTNHARSDGGPIYNLGPQPSGVMSGNYVTNPNGTATEGLYLDQGSTHWTLSNNVAAGFNIPLFSNPNSWDPCGTVNVTSLYITGGLVNGGSCDNVSGTVSDVEGIPALRIEDAAGLEAAYKGLAGITAPYETTASTQANFSRTNGTFTIDAAGADVFGSTNQYGAIYVPSAAGASTTTIVKVNSLSNTAASAKAGLMLRNSVSTATGSLGYAILALSPGGHINFQWDNTSSGGLTSTVSATTTATSVWLKLVRSGNSLVASYSTTGSSWTTVGTETLTGAHPNEDVGMFADSNSPGVSGQAVFSGFSTGDGTLTPYASAPASIVQSQDPNTVENPATYTIDAAGAGPWKSCCQSTDEYGALFDHAGSGTSSTTTVEVDAESATNPWSMAGIMIRNDMTGTATSLGYAALTVTPGNGVALLWDSNSDGYLDQVVQAGSGTLTGPIWLRLTRSASSVTGAYSTDGSTWTSVATETLTGAATTEDVGMFASSFDSGVDGHASFSNFSVTSAPFSAFSSTTATIVQGASTYSINAAGAGPWQSSGQTSDQYAALYEHAAAASTSTTIVKVTAESNTNPWTMAGIMLRNDMTGAPGSLGYAALTVTPGNGVALLWDNSSSGYLDQVTQVGSGTLTAPIWLKLVRSGSSITGSYSTNGTTWNAVGSATLTGANSTEDVGMYSSSFQAGTTATAAFSNFSIS